MSEVTPTASNTTTDGSRKWNSKTASALVIFGFAIVGLLVVVLVIALLVWGSRRDTVVNLVAATLYRPRTPGGSKRAAQRRSTGPSRLLSAGGPDQPLEIDPKTVSLDAIFNSFDQKRATQYALQSFCRCYPESTIVLYNDGGDPSIQEVVDSQQRLDLTAAEGKTAAAGTKILYTYHPENLNVVWTRAEADSAVRWVIRFHGHLQKLTRRWVILMEDDVLIKDRIRFQPNAAVFGGKFSMKHNTVKMRQEMLINGALSEWIAERRAVKCGQACPTTVARGDRFGASCCGGVIIDREFWMTNYDEKQVVRWIWEIYDFLPLLHNDILMSTLYLAWGGNILPNPEYIEAYWHPIAWTRPEFCIVHAYKRYYVPRPNTRPDRDFNIHKAMRRRNKQHITSPDSMVLSVNQT